MNNLLPSSVQLHLKFDLKGSTYNRRASSKERAKPLPTFKDLDFLQDTPDGMLLDADMYNAFCKTVQRDCLVRVGGRLSKGRNVFLEISIEGIWEIFQMIIFGLREEKSRK